MSKLFALSKILTLFKKLTLPKLLAILLFMLPASPATTEDTREVVIGDGRNFVAFTPVRVEEKRWRIDPDSRLAVELVMEISLLIDTLMLEQLDVSCDIYIDGVRQTATATAFNVQASAPRPLTVTFPGVVKPPERYLCVITHYQLVWAQDQPHRLSPTP